jgi:hypothetical protein
MQQKQDLKFITAMHVLAYSAIIRWVEIGGELLCLSCYRDPFFSIYNGMNSSHSSCVNVYDFCLL